jgi:hypothetical protein
MAIMFTIEKVGVVAVRGASPPEHFLPVAVADSLAGPFHEFTATPRADRGREQVLQPAEHG